MTRKEEKQRLRTAIRAAEQALPETYRIRSAAAICGHLLTMEEYRLAETVFCFVGTAQEIDTRPVLEDALSRGKRLCVPLCTAESGIMELRQITALSQLTLGTYGILEPALSAPRIGVDEVDFAVIPCLTCSRAGARLGRGGGYYDRFLSAYRAAAALVCREELLREELPVEPHDLPVHWVVSERGLYEDGIPAPIA